jgi:hypothetical protein
MAASSTQFQHEKTSFGLATSDPVGWNTARIELLEPATQSGRRYENGDPAAQRLGSQRALG